MNSFDRRDEQYKLLLSAFETLKKPLSGYGEQEYYVDLFEVKKNEGEIEKKYGISWEDITYLLGSK